MFKSCLKRYQFFTSDKANLMKQAILLTVALLMSSSLMAQTYSTVLVDYFTAKADDVDTDLDGWGVGVDLTHWFDNEIYVNVGTGLTRSSIGECFEGICVEADTDVSMITAAVGRRFENITPFVRLGYQRAETTYSIANRSFTDDETDWDYGLGALVAFGDTIFGISADGLRDADEGFTLTGEVTFMIPNGDGITIKIGRLVNADDLESTRFGIGWTRFF